MVKRIIGAVVVFAVISFGGWAWKHLTGAAETAKVGDCLAGQSEEDLRVVDCSDATAQHKVIGKVTDKSEAAFNTSAGDICSAFPTTESAFWWGERGGNGDVLCLEPMKG